MLRSYRSRMGFPGSFYRAAPSESASVKMAQLSSSHMGSVASFFVSECVAKRVGLSRGSY